MAFRWAKVIRGGRKPCAVEDKSFIAEAAGNSSPPDAHPIIDDPTIVKLLAPDHLGIMLGVPLPITLPAVVHKTGPLPFEVKT